MKKTHARMSKADFPAYADKISKRFVEMYQGTRSISKLFGAAFIAASGFILLIGAVNGGVNASMILMAGFNVCFAHAWLKNMRISGLHKRDFAKLELVGEAAQNFSKGDIRGAYETMASQATAGSPLCALMAAKMLMDNPALDDKHNAGHMLTQYMAAYQQRTLPMFDFVRNKLFGKNEEARDTAVKMLQTSAKINKQDAYYLALLFADGRIPGIKQDKDMAVKYMNKAKTFTDRAMALLVFRNEKDTWEEIKKHALAARKDGLFAANGPSL